MKGNKNIKRPIVPTPPLRKPDRTWARSTSEKSILFAENLASVFTPNSDNNNDDDIAAYLNALCQLSLPVRALTSVEIKNAIILSNPHKAPRHDLIVATILKNLPRKAVPLITYKYVCMCIYIYIYILSHTSFCHFPIQ
jgi:hypothetical protein